MSTYDDLLGLDPYQKQKWLESAGMRQAKLEITTSGKSLAELQQLVTELETQLSPLTKPQISIIEVWSCAVARIKEKPFVESYMLNYGPCQLLEFAESYFWGDSGAGIHTPIQKQYYYEEKLEVLQNLIQHGPDYLEKYQKMIESIRSHIEGESKSSTWQRWDNDYVTRKMIKWIKEWKGMHLS